MGNSYSICLGSVGGGLSQSPDGGQTWNRIASPIPPECNVRALAVHPNNPHHILAGTDEGLFLSEDNGTTWEKVDSPIDGIQIWSIAFDPTDPNTIFAGTKPDAFRSRDGGKTWEQLSLGVNNPCPTGVPRTTVMIVDPRDSRTIWAGIEVDGVYKSMDGGDSWVHLPDLGYDPFHGDIHGLSLKVSGKSAVYASTPFGFTSSVDEGESWVTHEFPKYHPEDQWSYCRGHMSKPDDPNTIFVGNGDMIPGVTGAIQMTKDGGKTWAPAKLPQEPNSVVYWFSSHPELPNTIVAVSLYGEVFASEDGGDTWAKRRKEFGEVRTVAVLPN